MKLMIEFSDFEPWSGAVDTWNKIVEAGKVDELEATLDELYPESMGSTTLNDLLWFEPEVVFDWLGMDGDEEDDFDKFCGHFSSCGFCPLFHGTCCHSKEHFNENHNKMMACIDGQDENVYDKVILDA